MIAYLRNMLMAFGPKYIEEVDFSIYVFLLISCDMLRSICVFWKTFFFGKPNINEKYNLFLSRCRILGVLFLCKSSQFFASNVVSEIFIITVDINVRINTSELLTQV